MAIGRASAVRGSAVGDAVGAAASVAAAPGAIHVHTVVGCGDTLPGRRGGRLNGWGHTAGKEGGVEVQWGSREVTTAGGGEERSKGRGEFQKETRSDGLRGPNGL